MRDERNAQKNIYSLFYLSLFYFFNHSFVIFFLNDPAKSGLFADYCRRSRLVVDESSFAKLHSFVEVDNLDEPVRKLKEIKSHNIDHLIFFEMHVMQNTQF